MLSFFIGACVLHRDVVSLRWYWLIWIETEYDTLRMLFLHSVFVFWVFLFTEWEQSFPSLIIHFFIFSELALVNNSVFDEDIPPQMCSLIFVGFILISCIPAVPHSSSPPLLHWEGEWLCDIFFSSPLILLFSPHRFFILSLSFLFFPIPFTHFLHTLSFQTLSSPSTANGLVDINKKGRKNTEMNIREEEQCSQWWLNSTDTCSFVYPFICFLAYLWVCFHHDFEQWWRGRAISLSSSHFPLWEENEK